MKIENNIIKEYLKNVYFITVDFLLYLEKMQMLILKKRY